ncbi:uncharacterized protein B0I36DRAFT_325748 [Microdochium trichocladiopsis]|uniref:Secreted protein n=1 Tax=Microdochium trichocladiopsis TaxID=1682393 RepID=A0A9P9BT31_9PEZI|nr:uncharacterized protein B0I36DRAFT_325748 [Microdochium trichocladiopsis]KAH7029426.1 hypothetical protein B0I36DRAFT_325748 [Microdochium trichocladiopsis]
MYLNLLFLFLGKGRASHGKHTDAGIGAPNDASTTNIFCPRDMWCLLFFMTRDLLARCAQYLPRYIRRALVDWLRME